MPQDVNPEAAWEPIANAIHRAHLVLPKQPNAWLAPIFFIVFLAAWYTVARYDALPGEVITSIVLVVIVFVAGYEIAVLDRLGWKLSRKLSLLEKIERQRASSIAHVVDDLTFARLQVAVGIYEPAVRVAGQLRQAIETQMLSPAWNRDPLNPSDQQLKQALEEESFHLCLLAFVAAESTGALSNSQIQFALQNFNERHRNLVLLTEQLPHRPELEIDLRQLLASPRLPEFP